VASDTETLTPAPASTTYAATTRNGNITVRQSSACTTARTHRPRRDTCGLSSCHEGLSRVLGFTPGACPAAAGSQAQRVGCATPQCCWTGHWGYPTPSPNAHHAAVLLLRRGADQVHCGQGTSSLLLWWWCLLLVLPRVPSLLRLLLPVALWGCQRGRRQGMPTCGAQCAAAHACLRVSGTQPDLVCVCGEWDVLLCHVCDTASK
jgi:hypothetical protein